LSNESTSLETLTPDERARLRKQLGDQAVRLAISSRWDEAVTVNGEFLRIFGDEPEALNRLGKALSEVGRIREAKDAYGRSIALDPTNAIARKNLDRLAILRDEDASAARSQIDTRLFVEETGKATVTKLQAIDAERGALLDAGDLVELQRDGNTVNVVSTDGHYVGLIEPRVGLRLAKMMAAGNQYSAALVSTTGDLRVMLRETFQHPSMIGKVSFPQARTSDMRSYTRPGLLRGQMEESEYSEDDDDVADEPDEGWTETGEDEEDRSTIDIDISGEDDESFD